MTMRVLVIPAVLAVFLILFSPIAAAANYSYDIAAGSISIANGTGSNEGKIAVSQGSVRYITSSDSITITGTTTTNAINVAPGVRGINIVLNNVNIDVSGISTTDPRISICAFDIGDGAEVELTLGSGSDNTFKSGIVKAGIRVEKPVSGTAATLRIDGDGILNAIGGSGGPDHWLSGSGAGIGSNGIIWSATTIPSGGDIIINSGTINATGGAGTRYSGAGIGGGGGYNDGPNAGNITIHGGTIIATGGSGNYSGPGIGGGPASHSGTMGTVLIDGGTVTARSGNGSYNSSGIGYGYANAVNLVRTDPASLTITGSAIVTASSANGTGAYAAIGHNDNGSIAIGGTATVTAWKGTNTYNSDCGTISSSHLVISGSPSITVYSPNKQGDEYYLDNRGWDDEAVKPIYAKSITSTVPVMAGIFPSTPRANTIVLTGGEPESSKTIVLPANYVSFATTVDNAGVYEGAMGIDVLQNSNTLSQTFHLISGINTFNVKQLDITPPDAPGGLTISAGTLINAQEETAGIEVVLSLGASGALANDVAELLLNTEPFPIPVRHVLNSADITANSCIITIPKGRLGEDGIKLITPRIIDEAGNIGPVGYSKILSLDTTAPFPATDVRIVPVGGTIVSDTLNGTNTNMQAVASIAPGEATDGSSTLYVNGIALATDTSISEGDTQVTFDLGQSSVSELQSKVTAGGIVTVELNDVYGNISISLENNPSLTVDYTTPSIESVTVPESASYRAGRHIDFAINFSESVFVNGGTPHIQIALETGGTVNANYISGSGTSSLVFRYTVSQGNQDPNGIEITSDEIFINEGSIRDMAGNDANLQLLNVEDTYGILVDTTPPSVLTVLVPDAVTYWSRQNLDLTVTFDENVVVNLENGKPSLSLGISSAGTVNADYVSGSGSNALMFRYTILPGDLDVDGIFVGEDIVLNNSSIQDIAGNDAVLQLDGVGDTSEIYVDAVLPEIVSATVDSRNRYIDITFSKGVYGEGNLTADNLSLRFSRNGGDATAVTISSLKKNDTDEEGMALSLGGGETVVRVFVNIIGTPSGLEAIEIGPLNGSTIFDVLGNAMVVGETTGVIYLQDQISPTLGTSGAIIASAVTSKSVQLTWVAATDQKTTAANLQYMIVQSPENNIATDREAVSHGAIAKDWTTNITTGAITGLMASTEYYFNVLVKDEAGNITAYTSTSMTTAKSPRVAGSSIIGNGRILINGVEETVVNSRNWIDSEGKSVTSITLERENVVRITESVRANPVVTLSMAAQADIASGIFTGDMANAIKNKGATLVLKTQRASYTLPSSEIDITDIAKQFGENVKLEDIRFTVSISEPSEEILNLVRNAAEEGRFTLVVPPVDFSVRCDYKGMTIYVKNFNSYVERTIAIQKGVDPSQITTAIYVEQTGTFRHVPTIIMEKDGEFYAKINSMTNSGYTVIHHSAQFLDIEDHWAEDTINHVGSRMIVKGIGNGLYQPNTKINRAEFSAIVVNALGLAPGSNESRFEDVTLTDWFNGYVDTAAQYALITGYTSATFGPYDAITREQAMSIITRAMKLTGLTVTLTDSEMCALLSEYTDGTNISSYAKESVAICVQTGIITGTTAHTLSPKEQVTRAEVAVMIQRLLQKSELI
jgi:hypothetical protein